jgi:hypothetical protein
MDDPAFYPGLNRTLSDEEYRRAERGEQDIDKFVTHRARALAREENRRREEEEWRKLEREHQEEVEKQTRAQWKLYHQARARSLQCALDQLIEDHRRQAAKLDDDNPRGVA